MFHIQQVELDGLLRRGQLQSAHQGLHQKRRVHIDKRLDILFDLAGDGARPVACCGVALQSGGVENRLCGVGVVDE